MESFMGKNKINIKAIIGVIAALLCVVVVLLLLVSVEKKREYYEKWGNLAVLAETDERAQYIIDNEELYPQEILDLYYRNNDDFEFVYNYPFHKDDYKTMSFTEEELNCDTVPALYMNDLRWGYEKIRGDLIRSEGCATVALTMASLYINKDNSIDPKIVADKAVELDAIGFFGGLDSMQIEKVAKALGFQCNFYNYDPDLGGVGKADIDTIRSIIDSGHVLMAGMCGDTFGGHALIIRSCSEDGVIYINDPASPEKTEMAWRFEDINPELYYIWELY